MLNVRYGAVTVKRKLSVRETGKVIRKSHLKKKIQPSLSSPYVTNQRSEKRTFLVRRKNGG